MGPIYPSYWIEGTMNQSFCVIDYCPPPPFSFKAKAENKKDEKMNNKELEIEDARTLKVNGGLWAMD